MKKNKLIGLLLLFLSINAYAEMSGNAIMGPWRLVRESDGDFNKIDLEISNITNVETTVLLSLITGKDSNNNTTYLIDTGGDRTSGFLTGIGDFAYYSESPDEGSVEMTIKPLDTIRIQIEISSGPIVDFTGYGKIVWCNESDSPVALVANYTTHPYYPRSFVINGGNPF